MFDPISVRAVMEPVERTDPDQSVGDAARQLTDTDSNALVVCNGPTPIGVITDTDVTAVVATGSDADTTTIREQMTSPAVTVPASADIEVAIERIRDHDITQVPVVGEDGEVVGIVTAATLSQYVPHLRRSALERDVDTTARQHDVRADTAYENDDWEYQYVGHEGQIDVGDELSFSKTVTEADVRAFAEASGDTNRLHLDEEFAVETRFGRRIVHGTLVAGLISAGLARLPGLTIYLSQSLSFRGPVDIGERITTDCTVVERLSENRFRLSTNVRNENDDIVIDGEATVISDTLPS